MTLAVESLANAELADVGIKVAAYSIIEDTIRGEDGYTGKPLKNFDHIDMEDHEWALLQTKLIAAITSCADQHDMHSSWVTRFVRWIRC